MDALVNDLRRQRHTSNDKSLHREQSMKIWEARENVAMLKETIAARDHALSLLQIDRQSYFPVIAYAHTESLTDHAKVLEHTLACQKLAAYANKLGRVASNLSGVPSRVSKTGVDAAVEGYFRRIEC